MNRDTIVQLIAPVVMVIALAGSGLMLPGLLRQSEASVLRYTNTTVEGAPPWVAIGTAIGAVRGLIVNILWVKVNAMKEKGLYYEVMADADLITKLQPRFAAVWGFHGHNMAYNISVATSTQEERWEWVNAGIRLVRDKGLRYNPNDMSLHRELAFWFGHKIEGVADDAHIFYKRMFCREWHGLLGEPPEEYQERIAWMRKVADAPETLNAAEQRTPGVNALVARLRQALESDETRKKFELNSVFLFTYSHWMALTQLSEAAKILGVEQQTRAEIPQFVLFDEIARDPAAADAWDTLLAHVRKRVLKDEYNMDPALMTRYTEELGPIDWRHGQAHALYWARKGSEMGAGRVREYDINIVLNNDSAQMHAMQDLARYGRISYDPFSDELPGRFPDPRWIDTIDRLFEPMYLKHINVPGAGGERFITFLQNFMSSAVREWYRAGETERAEAIMARLDKLFGGTGPTANRRWTQPLDVFVRTETFDEYQSQPHLAPSDIAASLRYGFKVGILSGRPEVLRDALKFVKEVTDWYKGNDWYDYINRFGEARMADLIGSVEDSTEMAYLQMITDPGINMTDRRTLWANTDKIEGEATGRAPAVRAMVYDRVRPALMRQFQRSELSAQITFEQAFPAPPGIENARQVLLQRQQERQQAIDQARERDTQARRGGGL